ncbi:hypothetical protein FRC12_022568 [Ceratobasidium sp. 428]|nr:hypothetical protein FRC12_022568 [Ceratobasidium sp. 428]
MQPGTALGNPQSHRISTPVLPASFNGRSQWHHVLVPRRSIFESLSVRAPGSLLYRQRYKTSVLPWDPRVLIHSFHS